MGEISDESHEQFQAVIDTVKDKGAESVVLGYTEIGILIRQ